MQNSEYIRLFKLTATLMELHEANPFKIKAYQGAAYQIEQLTSPLSDMSTQAIESTNGLGKSIAAKIQEINTTGNFSELSELLEITPRGILEILNIKGIGAKKIRTLWKELNIISREELLEACYENKVCKLKGFGEKTQQSIIQELIFSQTQKEKFLYAEVEYLAHTLEADLKEYDTQCLVSVSGEYRRKLEVIELLQFIVGIDDAGKFMNFLDHHSLLKKNPKLSGPFVWRGSDNDLGCKIEIKLYPKTQFYKQLLIHSAAKEHLNTSLDDGKTLLSKLNVAEEIVSEQDFYANIGLSFIEPWHREGIFEINLAKENKLPATVKYEDLKGILHNHTTYSDGTHTLREMAEHCKALGFEYLGICDHSKSGNFYNSGMYENKVKEQQNEIDQLNSEMSPFKIFKGIESDILNDGSLDYEDDVLRSFDFIVASIHSNLKMNEEKATSRLIKAIEDPFTTILGHLSGRLLLKRDAYPVDYTKIIDACAANNVVIEINADPRRLDMDWRWVIKGIEKGVTFSINPDAHRKEAYTNMKYGVYMAEKAGLPMELTLNAWPLDRVSAFFKSKKG